MKRKAILILAIFGIIISSAKGQSLINHGADIIISSGSSIVIDGDFENQLDGTLNNSGDILITGDWINNQTSGNLLLNTSGTVSLIGSSIQNFEGTHATYFYNLGEIEYNHAVFNSYFDDFSRILVKTKYKDNVKEELILPAVSWK